MEKSKNHGLHHPTRYGVDLRRSPAQERDGDKGDSAGCCLGQGGVRVDRDFRRAAGNDQEHGPVANQGLLGDGARPAGGDGEDLPPLLVDASGEAVVVAGRAV
ncbi:hypothetical protein [Streptomyces sp. WAC05950]|uniref:hypothetical protein n=1 Tax=Streptomyces sp. WAC05950 TaxID=2487419 RepID=UPI000F73A946|nr:hypothetical protein [Streptomyces sp. WAC05950]RST03780.1 hypothetical protein EF904_20930 [Streptomyces sp. WAC05950]